MPTRTKDTHDAMLWSEGGRTFWVCARCLTTEQVTARDRHNGSYRAAIAHLWRAHSIRRVWIIEQQPEFDRMVQIGFDLAVTHNRHF